MLNLSSRLPLSLFLLLITVLLSPSPTSAQIIPDRSLGKERSTVRKAKIKNLPSDVIEGGATRGSNLFHSFQEFNVRQGRGAYFNNPSVIQNIFSRVTGNNASKIFGTLGVLGNANLYLINPNGIVFGKNARLDVNGAFFGSTADSLVFDNNFEFSASNPSAPPLLTVDIPLGVRLRQSSGDVNSRANLATPNDLTLQGGNVNLTGSVVAGGNLRLEALDSLTIRDSLENPFFAVSGQDLLIQGTNIDIFALNHPQSALASYGNLTLKSPNPVLGEAHYYSGGSFKIEQFDGSLGELYSPNDPVIQTLGDVVFAGYQGASLHIIAGGKVEISGSIIITEPDLFEGLLETITLSNGENLLIAGSIEPTLDIRAGVDSSVVGIPIETGTGIFIPFVSSTTNATGADIIIGDVVISDASLKTGGKVFLTNQYFPNDSLSGNIAVNSIGAQGGGSITIDSRNNINTEGMINTTSLLVLGQGGSIQLLAGNDTTLNSMISTGGGSITIDSRNNINTEGMIDTSLLLVLGQGGSIQLLAGNDTTLNSMISTGGGSITIDSGNSILLEESKISTDNSSTGSRGDIKINANSLLLKNRSALSTSPLLSPLLPSNSSSQEGNIMINTQQLILEQGSQIATGTFTAQNAGDITIQTQRFIVQDNSNISASSNEIGKAGNITIEVDGSIDLSRSSGIQSQSNSTGEGGDIKIKTTNLTLRDMAGISVATSGDAKAGTITIDSSGLVKVLDGSVIQSSTFGSQPAGDILIKSEQLVVQDNISLITTLTDGSGKGGFLMIDTGKLFIQGGGFISTETSNAGNGGTLLIQASDSAIVSGQGDAEINLTTRVNEGATGEGGDLTITTGKLMIQDGRQVSAGTSGEGNSGKLTVNADSVQLSGLGGGLFTQTEGKGNSNDLTIVTGQLLVENGATLSTRTLSKGKAGILSITATEFVELTGNNSSLLAQTDGLGDANRVIINTPVFNIADSAIVSAKTTNAGKGGNIFINAPNSVTLGNNSQLTVEASGSGTAGNIIVTTDILTIGQDAELSATATATSTAERAGNINLNVNQLNISGDLGVFAETQSISDAGDLTIKPNNNNPNLNINFTEQGNISASTESSGDGGSITLTAPETINIRGNGEISTKTSGTGKAGIIEINTANQLNLSDGVNITASTDANSTGEGGSIFINTPTDTTFETATNNSGDSNLNINLDNQASIAVNSEGDGNGGSIFITSENLRLNNQSEVSAETASGTGGNIRADVSNIISQRNNSPISATAGNQGDGGNITLNTKFLIGAENSDITANAFEGTGGNIQINARGIFRDFTSEITASSQFGQDGVVETNTPETDPSQALVDLPSNVVDANDLIARNVCRQGEQSEFTVRGKGGLPESPEEYLNSDEIEVNTIAPTEETSNPTSENNQEVQPQTRKIIPAQGWVANEKGELVLVAYATEDSVDRTPNSTNTCSN